LLGASAGVSRQAYLLCGPPLAGKSAFCRQIVERFGAEVCSPDLLVAGRRSHFAPDGFGERAGRGVVPQRTIRFHVAFVATG